MNNIIASSEEEKGLKKLFSKYPFWSWTIIGFLIGRIPKLEWVFPIFLMIGLYSFLRHRGINNKKNVTEQKESMMRGVEEFVANIKERKALTPISSSLVLGPKEQAFLEEETALQETRSVRQFRSTGVRVRLMKGLSVGQSAGKAESHKEWRILDTGKLILTNKKLVFDGGKEDRTIPLDKILTISPMLDAIEVSSSSRSGSMVFPVSNPFIWATTIRILTAVEDPLNLGELDLNVQIK